MNVTHRRDTLYAVVKAAEDKPRARITPAHVDIAARKHWRPFTMRELYPWPRTLPAVRQRLQRAESLGLVENRGTAREPDWRITDEGLREVGYVRAVCA